MKSMFRSFVFLFLLAMLLSISHPAFSVPFTATAIPKAQTQDSLMLFNESDGTLQISATGNTPPPEVVFNERTLSSINAFFQFLDKNHRPAGEHYERFSFGQDYVHPVTGEICADGTITARISVSLEKRDEIDHWQINGVPYYFSSDVWFITVYGIDCTMEFRAVYKGGADWRDKTPDENTASAEQTIRASDAQIKFVDFMRIPRGNAFRNFDFSNDYMNYATKENVSGGSFSGRVEALIPEGMALNYWMINGIPFHFNIQPRCITVIDLDTAAVFRPVFRKKQP